MFWGGSDLVDLVNNFDDYVKQGRSFRDSFEGKDPEFIEKRMEGLYKNFREKLLKEDEEYIMASIGLEKAEDQIQDIEVENYYMKKLNKAIEEREESVGSNEEALNVIEAGWETPESYFEETNNLLESWESFLETAETFRDIYVHLLEHFNQVREPWDLKMSGEGDTGELHRYHKHIREWLEEKKENLQKAKEEYEGMEGN